MSCETLSEGLFFLALLVLVQFMDMAMFLNSLDLYFSLIRVIMLVISIIIDHINLNYFDFSRGPSILLWVYPIINLLIITPVLDM